jgi:hypothetical protein
MNQNYLTPLYKMIMAGMKWIDKHPDANVSFIFASDSTTVSDGIIPHSDETRSLLQAIRDTEEDDDLLRSTHMESLAMHLIIGELKGYFK